ncbi:MAG: c-type cytochrome [Myxococcales bacterium]|nr:c-type cytochrome [Myxococcales bacterium]
MVLEGTADVGATVALGRSGARLRAFVADEDGRALRIVDVDGGHELAAVPLDGAPSAVVASREGRLYVALADTSRVVVLDLGDDAVPVVRCSVPVAPEPTGLALAPGGEHLLVASRWGHALGVWRTADLALERSVELPRDPYAVMAGDEGREAWVLHLVGGRLSVVDLASGSVRELALGWDVVRRHLGEFTFAPGPGGSWEPRPMISVAHRVAGSTHALARTADGRVLVPAALMTPGGSASPAFGYGSLASPPASGGLVVVDPHARSAWTSEGARAGRRDDECLLPRAAAVDTAHDLVLVACLGADLVAAYDTTGPFAHGLQHYAVPVPAGPTGIAVDTVGARAVVWSQFELALCVFALRHVPIMGMPAVAPRLPLARRIDLAPRAPLAPEVALGRSLFHAADDRRLADDGRACASCHPGGRDDGLTWSTVDGPRQTPVLLARLREGAPFGWDGGSPTLDAHLARTLTRLGGTGLGAPERAALAAYLDSLSVAPSWSHGGDATRVARGRELYEARDGGCVGCHRDGAGDGKSHDVGSRSPRDATGSFDTPSLRGVSRSAPYFHDGRYPTLGAMLTDPASGMAPTARLPADDLDALLAYLGTL